MESVVTVQSSRGCRNNVCTRRSWMGRQCQFPASTFIPPSGLVLESSCQNETVVLRLRKRLTYMLNLNSNFFLIDRSVPGTKSQLSPSFCLQACYPRAPAGMKMCCFVWKKNTHAQFKFTLRPSSRSIPGAKS